MNAQSLDALDRILGKISENPVLFGLLAPLCILIWRLPQIIMALVYFIRESRKARVEIDARRERIRRQLKRDFSKKRGVEK